MFLEQGKCVAGKPQLFDLTLPPDTKTSPATACTGIAALVEGGIVLLGNHEDSSTSLSGMNAAGQLQWQEFYTGFGGNGVVGRDLIRMGSGDLLVVGSTVTPEGSSALRLLASPGAKPMELPVKELCLFPVPFNSLMAQCCWVVGQTPAALGMWTDGQ